MSAVASRGEDVADPRVDLKPRADRPRLSYTRLEGAVAEKLDAMFGVKDSLVEVNPGRVLLPAQYDQIGQRILDLEVRQDDVWLVSYPRTGSTWAQEMVWCVANDMDLERAKTVPQLLRCPLLELSAVFANESGEWKEALGNSVDYAQAMASPRFLKSHLPLELLPTQLATARPKVVYVTRNPKDMCVSYYHYCQLIHDMTGSLEDFCELFLQDRAPIGPIWNHILGFWRRRHEPNILFLTYEGMKRDLAGAIRTTASFLGKTLSEDAVARLEEHLSFRSMKSNPAVNLEPIIEKKNGPDFLRQTSLRFIRKGEVGDWANHFSPDMAARFDAWTEENLRGSGLRF